MSNSIIYIVDTNVPLVANGASSMSIECKNNCVLKLAEIMSKGRIAIDDDWHIVKEYTKRLRPKGEPRLGDIFFRWVLTNMNNPKRCEKVHISESPDFGFHEFPKDVLLNDFDKSDRKFVAVASAHKKHPPILQAADSKWLNWSKCLKKHNIEVIFLCKDDVKKIQRKKKRMKHA